NCRVREIGTSVASKIRSALPGARSVTETFNRPFSCTEITAVTRPSSLSQTPCHICGLEKRKLNEPTAGGGVVGKGIVVGAAGAVAVTLILGGRGKRPLGTGKKVQQKQ